MKVKNYIQISLCNLLGRKKTNIINLFLMTISLSIILLSTTLYVSLNTFIHQFLLNSLNHRTLLVSTFKLQPNVKEILEEIVAQDENILEIHEELFGAVVEVADAPFLNKGIHPFEENDQNLISLIPLKNAHEDFLLTGRFIDPSETHVGIIPQKFYPHTNYEIGYFEDDTQYINGEDLIGEVITVNYHARDFNTNSMEIIETFEYPFKVVGTYDILPNIFHPYEVIIPANDLKAILENLENRELGLAENYSKVYSIVVNDQKNVPAVISKIEQKGFHARPVATLGPIGDISNLIIISGSILGFIFLIISITNLALTMVKSVKKRTTELGLMKAIGYHNQQITTLISFEALIIGISSLTLSLIIFTLFASVARWIIKNYGSLYMQGLKITLNFNILVFIILIGLLVPLLASISAIRYATKVPPKTALGKGREYQ